MDAKGGIFIETHGLNGIFVGQGRQWFGWSQFIRPYTETGYMVLLGLSQSFDARIAGIDRDIVPESG